MMDVEQQSEQISASSILTTLLSEFSAVADYRILRDSLPRRLVTLLKCRCVLFYQRLGETLQFVSGSFDERPGWSSSLLAVAHINPIGLKSDRPEACAWRERHAIAVPASHPALVAVPLIYRHRGIGILVAVRQEDEAEPSGSWHWTDDEIQALEAVTGVVALLLENTRLLERDRERIHELSLLNSISSQMNCSMYELPRLRSVVIQRAREISTADRCALLESSATAEESEWITPVLREMLFQRFREQRSPLPLLIERPGDFNNPRMNDYLDQLSASIKTFFAVPLLSGRAVGRRGRSLLRGSLATAQEITQEPKVLGIIVGAYQRPWRLHREEIVLLQVLAGQASAVLENMHLMEEVVEARNEARRLLDQVLEDQGFKEVILESIPSGLITTDRAGCITTFNRAAEAILGYHPYEVLGQPLHRFLKLQSSCTSYDLQQADPPAPALQSPAAGHTVQYRVGQSREVQSETVITEDRQGREVVLDADVLPLYDAPGTPIGTLVTFIDVTSVHRLEEEKRRLDRLASLGEMAANVAHEVRNPLASIKTSMQMLIDDLAGGELTCSAPADWAQESVAVVLKEVERLDTIVRDLLLFARPRQLHRVNCNLADLSDRVLQFIQPQCSEANVVVHRVYGDIPPVWVDMAQMEQVLLNLYMNAVQAMPDGGILTVAFRLISADHALRDAEELASLSLRDLSKNVSASPLYKREHEVEGQQWVEMSICDTGVGIPSDQLERIFQPFFTTKAHGIGLGLAITRRLVEDHGGYIRVEGHFGYGATIAVRLPLVTDRLAPNGDEGL
jgi:signal transduction histidine kinase/GAF domain-containing protein